MSNQYKDYNTFQTVKIQGNQNQKRVIFLIIFDNIKNNMIMADKFK